MKIKNKLKSYTSSNEHELMLNIIEVLKAKGCRIERINVGKRKTIDGRWFDTGAPKGYSDLSGCTPCGKAVYIEVKFGTNKPSSEQIAFLLDRLSCGAYAGIAYSISEALNIAGGAPEVLEAQRVKLEAFKTTKYGGKK